MTYTEIISFSISFKQVYMYARQKFHNESKSLPKKSDDTESTRLMLPDSFYRCSCIVPIQHY